MEAKFLTPIQLWQDFEPDGTLDVNYVSVQSDEEVTIKELYFNAVKEEEGAVRAYARIYIPNASGKNTKKFILYLADPQDDPIPNVVDIASRGYAVGYVDLSGSGEAATAYSGSLSYGRYEEAKNNLHNCTPSAKASPVYLWARIQRRFLSLIADMLPKAKVIAFGANVTNEILWPLCAMDARIYGGVSVLGSGVVQMDDDSTIATDENAQKWAIAMSPQAYAKYTACPMLIVTAANHVSCTIEKLDSLVKLMPEPEMCSTVVSNRLCTQITDSSYFTLWRWVEGRYTARKELPKSPVVNYKITPAGIECSVAVDTSDKKATSVSLYYAYDETYPPYRAWRAITVRGDEEPRFVVKIAATDKLVYAYASVRYRDGVEMASTPIRIVLDDTTPRHKLIPSKLLYDTSMEMAFFAETKGIMLDSSIYGVGKSPDGISGFYTDKGDLVSFCVGETRRLRAEGCLQISAYTTEERTITMIITVRRDGTYHDYTAPILLRASEAWQRVSLDADDFRDENMLPMSDWSCMKKVRIRHAQGVLLNNMLWT